MCIPCTTSGPNEIVAHRDTLVCEPHQLYVTGLDTQLEKKDAAISLNPPAYQLGRPRQTYLPRRWILSLAHSYSSVAGRVDRHPSCSTSELLKSAPTAVLVFKCSKHFPVGSRALTTEEIASSKLISCSCFFAFPISTKKLILPTLQIDVHACISPSRG